MRYQVSNVAAACVLPSVIVALASEVETANRPNTFKKWRQDNPPKMVVFGDSLSDTGRRYNAPASFQFEEYGIGPFPFKRLYDGSGTDVSCGYFRKSVRTVTPKHKFHFLDATCHGDIDLVKYVHDAGCYNGAVGRTQYRCRSRCSTFDMV